jgi:hypothetical protein
MGMHRCILYLLRGMRLAPLLVFAFVGCALAQGTQVRSVSDARRVVEQFCQAEFDGDDLPLREKFIMLSPKRESKLSKGKYPLKPLVFQWNWDSAYVVSSYQVRDVTVKEADGTATVVYTRLARQEEASAAPKMIPDYKEVDVVQLKLVQNGERWWILDPPLPRVSKAVLIKNHEGNKICFDPSWIHQASDAQKGLCHKQQQNLETLKALPN